VLWNGEYDFEVQEREDRRYIVNLVGRTCTCRYWQLSGLPCCHAISCIYKASKLLDDFIAPCFTKAEYLKTYAHVEPVEGQANWAPSFPPRPPLSRLPLRSFGAKIGPGCTGAPPRSHAGRPVSKTAFYTVLGVICTNILSLMCGIPGFPGRGVKYPTLQTPRVK
jgi:hypothetical protein